MPYAARQIENHSYAIIFHPIFWPPPCEQSAFFVLRRAFPPLLCPLLDRPVAPARPQPDSFRVSFPQLSARQSDSDQACLNA